MKTITLEELLEAGCHFGHQVTRHNPKSRDYVFEARDNIHIIDLAKTKEGLETAANFVRDLGKKNGTVIVVATKRQAQPIVDEEVKRAISALSEAKLEPGIFFVTKRWIGGTLTNFSELEKNLKKLKDLTEKLQSTSEKAKYTKKERGLLDKERQKLENFYAGLSGMKKLPDALIVVDTHTEHLAVREARQTHVATVGVVDTNADPTIIDYPVPANDDAVGSIKILTAYLVDAWIEGRLHAGHEKNSVAKKEEKTETEKEESAKKESKTKKESN